MANPNTLHSNMRRRRSIFNMSGSFMSWIIIYLVFLVPSEAAFLSSFTNCMAASIQNTPQLQWIPEAVWVVFNSSSGYNLNITVYGNVTGQRDAMPLPLWNNSIWNEANFTNGKIIDSDPSDVHNGTFIESTLEANFDVLSYTPYYSGRVRFCNTTNRQCPIAPVFNATSINDLPTFSIAHDMESSYAFTSIHAYLHFKDNRTPAFPLGCILADITPYLGSSILAMLTYIPLAILILVAIATIVAAVWSPWGSWDIFRNTTNYGRDADLLRLITPGFGDCLQYIQFIFLSGSLTLDYPGFFQPATSAVSWSSLVFNQSFVDHNTTSDDIGAVGVIDGIYITNSTYGLQAMSQIVGLANDRNIWTGMIIWLLIIILVIVVAIQIGFAVRWVYRKVSNTREEDLRAKNLPMSVGNVIRIVFNYFLLPLVAFSMYELVIAGTAIRDMSSIVPIPFAAIALLLVISFIIWIFRFIAKVQPRSLLFDDFRIVLLYGPLYNTYSDNAAAFSLVPLLLNFIRGIAIGAVQRYGIAQLVILITCEIILIITLNAFRPFSSPTSMNAYHTIFSVIRLVILILMITFIPTLAVDDAPRGWVGYAILILHGIVLLAGFFLHSLQTLIEVVARLLGAGDDQGIAARGGLVKVFGVRQLSRRLPRHSRHSMASDAAMLAVNSEDKRQSTARSRSLSASSNLLLGRSAMSDRQSVALESAVGGALSHAGSAATPYTPTGDPTTPYSYLPSSGNIAGIRSSGIVNIKAAAPADPWFRPPRPRKNTTELQSPGTHSQGSMSSSDWQKITADDPDSPELTDGRESWVAPLPAHLGNLRERSGSNPDESARPKPDYATREVDYYYGVRGPALSHAPTRRLKTGPADPTGPVSSATGWFKGLFGGKTKEKGKGFEVVRSSRMPPRRSLDNADIALEDQEPYQDHPEGTTVVPSRRRTLALDDEGDAVGGGTRRLPSGRVSPVPSNDRRTNDNGEISDEEGRVYKVTMSPPILDIDTGEEFAMPTRFGSKASGRPSRYDIMRDEEETPDIPRKSSRRKGSNGSPIDLGRLTEMNPLPSVTSRHLTPDAAAAQRMPFADTDGSNSQHNRNPSMRTGDSSRSGITSSSHSLGNHNARIQPGIALERPSSLGYVQQHRAGDALHVIAPGEHVPDASTAELVADNYSKPDETPRLVNF